MESLKLAQLQQAKPAANIQPESCICRLCRDDVSRIHNAYFIPRWRKTNQTTKPQCCHPDCGNTSYKTTKLATKARVFELLNVQHHSQESTDDQATALCTEHYMTLYRSLHSVNRKCGVCRKPLTDLSKSRNVLIGNPKIPLRYRFLR